MEFKSKRGVSKPGAMKEEAIPRHPEANPIQQVRAIMASRIQMCKSKGFVAVDADNVDGYENPTGATQSNLLGLLLTNYLPTENQMTGFPLTSSDQLSYNTFLAQTAHALGLAAGLKNDIDQITDLVSLEGLWSLRPFAMSSVLPFPLNPACCCPWPCVLIMHHSLFLVHSLKSGTLL